MVLYPWRVITMKNMKKQCPYTVISCFTTIWNGSKKIPDKSFGKQNKQKKKNNLETKNKKKYSQTKQINYIFLKLNFQIFAWYVAIANSTIGWTITKMPVLWQWITVWNSNSTDAHFEITICYRRTIADRIWQCACVYMHKKLLGYAR